jgi:hypothetical protein
MSLRSMMGWFSGVSFNARIGSDNAFTNYELKAAVTGYHIYVTDIDIDCGATARAFKILDGADGTVLWQASLAANTNHHAHLNTPLRLTVSKALDLTSAGASVGAFAAVHGFIVKD